MIKKIFTFPLALILALLIAKPYFHAGIPYTHDGENHLARFANYKIAIREGQIPPRFAPNLMNHYGYPVFNYNYPLANILSLPFSFLKINYEVTFKLLSTIFIFAGLAGVYHWLNKLRTPYKAMLFGTAIYAASPFIWSTVLYRGNIGEIMAWGIFPWLLYLIESLRGSGKWAYTFKTVIMTLFLLSHNIAVMFGLPMIMIYALVRYKKDSIFWMRFLSTIGFAIALSLWFWLPAIAEKNLVTVGEVALINDFTKHFPSLKQLISSPMNFGFSIPGKIDSISFSLGITQLFTLVLSGVIIAKILINKKINSLEDSFKLLALFFIGAVLLIFFQLKITAPIWELIPIALFIQFSWRLSLFLSVAFAGLGAMIWPKINNKIRWFLVGILTLQLLSFSRMKPVDYFHRNNIDYDAFTQSTTVNNENLPKNFSYLDIADWQPTPKIIDGQGDIIKVEYWTGSRRQYEISVKSAMTIAEPTMDFAGWETIVLFDGKKSIVDYIDNEQIEGRIAYRLEEPGKYEIRTQFSQKTWPRIVGNGVSIVALIISLVLVFRKNLKLKRELNFYLNWKIFLFFVGLAAPLLLIYDPSFPYASTLLANSGLPESIYSWVNFDGVHYLTIADKGYLGTGLIQAFFPLYPILVNGLNQIINNYFLAGLTLNFIVGFLLLRAWKKIVDLETNARIKNFSLYQLLFLFPTSLFFNSFYSEALFLYLVLLSFLNARKGHWLKAGLVAALASATRLVGIFLVPALLVELWLQKSALREANQTNQIKITSQIKCFAQKYWKQILAITTGSLGLASYMIYLQRVFGDPLYFFHLQSEFGGGRQESIVLYPQVVWRYLKILWTARPFDLKYYSYAQEFIFGTLGLAGIIWSWFRVRKSYVVFSALAFLLPTLTGTFSSMPRYFLASFSVFILIIKLLDKNKTTRLIWLSLSTLWLIFNTILFIQGYWVA
ncbi:MAG: hypothetical protein HOF08_00145 [Candidatus Pacebacteria bacterium]|nr:hypothetical protein [Candidatus Paceibacterota bacterium]